MDSLSFYLSGLGLVLSIFLIIVTSRAYGRSRVKLFGYLIGVFTITLLDSLLFIVEGLTLYVPPISTLDVFLASEVVILVLFYFGAVRGS